jgi:hypothetical protein
VAALFAVLGAVGGGPLLARGVVALRDEKPRLGAPFDAGQSTTLDLRAGRTSTVYVSGVSSPGACTGRSAAGGGEVIVVRAGYPFDFTAAGATWKAAYDVAATRDGRYTLSCGRSAGTERYAVGDQPQLGSLAGTPVASVLIGAGIVIVGLSLGGMAALGLALRRRARRVRLQQERLGQVLLERERSGLIQP